MKRAVLIMGALAGVLACGSNFSDDVAILPDGSFVIDATVPDGPPPFDAGKLDTGPAFNGGGPFQCLGCICDGTENVCISGGGGGGPPKAPTLDASDDADDASDASDAGADASDAEPACPDSGSSCIAIPLACLPKPTCDCLDQVMHTGCACTVSSDGNGFVFVCPPRP